MSPFPHPTRRQFLRSLAGGVAGVPCWTAARGEPVRTVSLIHTTDLHGHILPTQTYRGVAGVGGLARCATLIREWRRQNPHSLLLDIGDVYQGTRVSQRNGGELMVRLFNKLGYDSWTLGNHEFDWGVEAVQRAVGASAMPVLTANVRLDGTPPGSDVAGAAPFANIAPYMIKEVAGFKIGVIGVLTPGLPYWLRPELTAGIEVSDPAEAVRVAARSVRLRGADAVVVTGHMGHRFGNDDFANRVSEITEKCPDIDVFIGGHSHIDVPSYRANGALYTQAGYHGIYLGRVDLAFSRHDHRLVDKRSFTVMMDDRFAADPVVLDTARADLDGARSEFAEPVGALSEKLSAETRPGSPSDVQRLHAASIRHSLRDRGVEVDAVLHGQFVKDDVTPGVKTLADMWQLAPYENRVVTADLTRDQLMVVAREVCGARSARNFIGLEVHVDEAAARGGDGSEAAVRDVTLAEGRPLDPGRRYRVAMNSYDSQSGGQRFMRLRGIVREPQSNAQFHAQETRDALTQFFVEKRRVGLADL